MNILFDMPLRVRANGTWERGKVCQELAMLRFDFLDRYHIDETAFATIDKLCRMR